MDLPEFLMARYDEDDKTWYDPAVQLCRERPDGFATGDDLFVMLVRARDHTAVNRSIVRTYQHTQPGPLHNVMWSMLLLLAQPYEGDPSFDPDWLAELAGLTTTPT